jgi:hypothetical protein
MVIKKIVVIDFPSTITRELDDFMVKVLNHLGLKRSNLEEVHNT